MHHERVLAIHPVSRGFGFVVLEGPEDLIDYGVAQLKHYDQERCLSRVASLMARCEPSLLLTEDPKCFHRSARTVALLTGTRELARAKKVRWQKPSRKQVRTSRRGAQTKYQRAVIIAERFPELASRLPPKRKPWQSEDVRMAMFTACALALTYFSNTG